MTLLVIVLVASGIVLWDAHFAGSFTIGLRRLAGVAHAVAAWLAIILLIVQVYAAIWVKGTMRDMTDGRVTAGWAWKHHRKWLREQVREQSGD